MARVLLNKHVDRTWTSGTVGREPLAFHARLPGYRPTPLHHLRVLAQRIGVGEVLVKDESRRLGLPAFKILGASCATYREVCRRLGEEPEWSSIDELREQLRPILPLRLITATDGNHGRGVARIAGLFGFGAWVTVPSGTAEARINGIESERATVHVVEGTFDDAVAIAAAAQDERSLLVQDTSWPGYEQIPAWIIEGYSTMLYELDDALAEANRPAPAEYSPSAPGKGGKRRVAERTPTIDARNQDHNPGVDLVIVQIGVGSLAAAVVSHYRRAEARSRPRILGVEPVDAACGLAACENDGVVTVPGPHNSIMAGLNCGTLASGVWPILRAGLDGYVAVEDQRAREAMRELATCGIVSGESGAAGLGALLELTRGPGACKLREALGIDATSRVLVISTEGATDPVAYEKIVGRTADEVAEHR
jgi:diaminopropionate ammonia-lyase